MDRREDTIQGWQPIETAPRDCERLLLWSPKAGPYGRGAVVFGRTYGLSSGSLEVRGEGMLGDWEFTHWMPLPAPPNTSIGERDDD
jgi:hypothetical protein